MCGGEIGVDTNGLASLGNSLIELPDLNVCLGQVGRRCHFAWVDSLQQHQHFDPLAQVSGSKSVIEIRDAEFFEFAHPIPQGISLFRILSGQSRPTTARIHRRQHA